MLRAFRWVAARGGQDPGRIDVRVLVCAPMAHLRGEPGAVSVVQVPIRSGRTRAGCTASAPARSTGASGTSTASGVFRRPGASVAAGRCCSRGCVARRGAPPDARGRGRARCDRLGPGQGLSPCRQDRQAHRLQGHRGLVRHRAHRQGLSPRLRQPASVGKLSGPRGPPLGAADRAATGGISRA